MNKLLSCGIVAAAGLAFSVSSACASGSDLQAIMKARGLTEKDILAAAKTYQPSGKKDDYIVFSSGGQVRFPHIPASMIKINYKKQYHLVEI